MRTPWLLLALALMLSGVACDTQQPTDAGKQVITVAITGTAEADVWDIWDVWIDVDGNCEIDPPPDGDDFEASFKGCQQPAIRPLPTTVPWRYSAVLTIIRAGATSEELIATTVGTSDAFSNLSFYDDTLIQELADKPCSGLAGGQLWVNGKRLTAANQEIMEGCLGMSNLLPANVLGQLDHYDVVVGQGDTVVFRSRKASVDTSSESEPYDDIAIGPVNQFAEVFVDGVAVVPQGETDTGSADGGGISISVRLR